MVGYNCHGTWAGDTLSDCMSKVSILLAEDNPPDIFLIRRALAEAGIEYDLRTVEDAESAAKLIQRLGRDLPYPDIALVDLNMPRGDGTELIRLLRQHCGAIPVIVCSSSDYPADRAAATEMGADEYFRKPISLDEFMKLGQVVRDLLGRRSAQSHKAG